MSKGVRILVWLFVVAVAFAAIGAFVMFGPPGVGERLAKPSFCISCHNMKPMYRGFVASPHGDDLESCNDCHLPNDSFVRHWFWDGIVGMRDLVKWNLGLVPSKVEAKPRTKVWVRENCMRCHGSIVDEMNNDRECWSCHRWIYHRLRPGVKS